MNLNNILTAADTTAAEVDGQGIFAKATDFLTKGVPSAAVSGLVSLANTGIFYKNKIVGGDTEELDTAAILDQGSASMGQYYRDNQQALDTLGFVAASFIPGSMAVAGVRAAQAGRAAGAFRYSGMVPAVQQEKALRAGLTAIAEKGPSVFESINASKRAALAWGFADNVLQAAAFETAAAVTLYRSPTLKDESFGDIAWDVAKSSLFGGAIGGAIEGIMVNGIFKNAARVVDGKLRQVDTITSLKNLGMGVGDESFTVIDSVLDLTRRQYDATVPFKYRVNGREQSIDLNVNPLMTKTAQVTQEKALEMVQGRLANISADPSVGRVLAANLMKKAEEGLAAGLPTDQIRAEMGDLLWGLKRVDGVGSDDINFAADVFYVLPGRHVGTREGLEAALTTTKPGKTAQAYVMRGRWEDAKMGTLGQGTVPADLREAWKAGYDSVLDPSTGRIEFNPVSEIFKKINPKTQQDAVMRVYNPRMHTAYDDAVPYIADIATQNSALEHFPAGVKAGKKAFTFSTTKSIAPTDVVEATARHYWAEHEVKSLAGVEIQWNDFALLNKLREMPWLADESTMIRKADGTTMKVQGATNLPHWIMQQKVEAFNAMEKGIDHRIASGILGVEPQWVELVSKTGGDLTAMAKEMPLSFRPLASFGERENLILSYDKASMDVGPAFEDGMLAYRNRVKHQTEKLNDAVRSIVPKEIADTMPEFAGVSAKQAESSGAGPGLASFSNADYNDPLRAYLQSLGQWMQNAGTTMRSQSLDALQPFAAKILTNPTPELGKIVSLYRADADGLALYEGRVVDLAFAKAVKGLSPEEVAQRGIKPKTDIPLGEDARNFLQTFASQHSEYVQKMEVLRAAQGLPKRFDPDRLYLPPIDTRKTPYFALVKEPEGRAFSSGEVSMVTARDPEQLRQLIADIKQNHPHLEIHLKGDTEAYYKAKAQYDFQSGLNNPDIDSTLKKSGVLRDFAPVMEPTAVIDQFVDFIGKRDSQFLRNVVSAKNAQLFSELDWLSVQNTKLAESKMGYIGRMTGKTIEDPFGDYKRLALGISKKSEYPIWHQANDFVDMLGTRAYQIAERTFGKAKAGQLSWEDANKELESVGLTGPFRGEADYFNAQLKGSGNLFRTAVAKANSLLATVGLRLDAANAAVNILSSPIMQAAEVSAIRNSLKGDAQLLGKFDEMRQVLSPDGKLAMPTIGKLWAGATSSFFGPSKEALLKRYTDIGVVKGDMQLFHAMIEDLSLLPTLKDAGAFAKAVDAATEKGAKWTGNNFAEQFTRFVSADMMRQLTEPVVAAGKMSTKEQDAFIRIFVNRTQGNYVASQRPILFQGTVGAAVSLFQTYSFNLYQQLFRHIENRDLRTIAVMGGLQSGLFGLNGLPMFDAINTHLIGMASINEGHRDAYSTVVNLTGKQMGDWALYGSLSAFPLFGDGWPGLYTRGDLNPRHLTILPTSLADVPAVSVGTRMLQAIQGFGESVSAGSGLGSAMLGAMEHNGLSRPLAGLATVMQGEATTSKGSLIAAHSDFWSVATATRIAGARPMDEAVALNTKFRLEAYKAYDRERIEALGTAVKKKLRAGDATEEDFLNFAAEYAARGGRVESYNAAMKRWMKEANQSTVNTLMSAHKTVYGQRLMEVMGGDPLPDYANQPAKE